MIGNTNMTLQAYSDIRNNSNNTMIKVDADEFPSTNNSSSATLALSAENGANPECSNILFAGLYWSARTDLAPTTLEKRTVKFRGPGESSYTSYVANSSDIRFPGDDLMYVSFVEVTTQVQQAGLGEYWVADMALTTGNGASTGYYGGWGLIVVYENSVMNHRDITVFDGYAYVIGGEAQWELPVTGFTSALSGDVNMKLGLMAGEGDVAIFGDQFEIQQLNTPDWQLLNHGDNVTNNFFNSSIFTGGNPRNPNLQNNTGMDISMFNIPNPGNTVIANGQTNTKFRYSSTQDTYIIYSICMAVDSYEPIVEGFLSTVSVNDIPTTSQSLTVAPGDEIEYKVEIRNRGTEPVHFTRIEIPLPYAAVLLTGSSVNVYPPASSAAIPYVDAGLGANGTLVWDFGTLPLSANPNDLLADISFTLMVSEDCSLYQNFNCSAPSVQIDGTISGTGSLTGVQINNQPLYVGYSAIVGCFAEPLTGPFEIDIEVTDWVAGNCNPGSEVREFIYCNRTTPISIAEVLGFYPEGTRFFNTTQTIEYTVSNPFPNVPGPTTYYALLPDGTCILFFTIEVSTLDSAPSVSGFPVEYCQFETAIPIVATPSNPSYTLFYYAPGSSAPQPSITPPTSIAGEFVYQVAEGPSTNCISTALADIPVHINPLPVITAAPAQPLCFGQTGSVVLSATGGTGTLTFDVSNPPTTGLGAGSYSYSVFDIKGCEASASAVINPIPDQPEQPELECWEQANWNSSTCQWVITGSQPEEPSAVNCWDDYQFNSTSCSWVNMGSQPVEPETECFESAVFNTQTCQWDIEISDNTIPVISGPGANAQISCPEIPQFSAPTVTDSCGDATVVVVSDNTVAGSCPGTYSRTITWKAVDNFGNESGTVSQTITVVDTAAPSISAAGANATVNCFPVPVFTAPTATDACDPNPTIVLVSDVTVDGACAGTYVRTMTWKAVDACGNESAAVSQSITVQDITAPVITAAGVNATVDCLVTPVFTAPTATDACDPNPTVVLVSDVTVDGSCAGSYVRTKTWKAVDACGNESAAVSQSITVVDTTAPYQTNVTPAVISVECEDAIPAFNPLFADDCDDELVLTSASETSTISDCEYTIERSVTATDGCGNSVTVTQVVHVADFTAPVVVSVPADVTVECGSGLPTGAPVFSDNCSDNLQTCLINGYQYSGGRVFWIPAYGTDFASSATDPLTLTKLAGGKAHLSGTIQRLGDASKRFAVSLWFFNESNYSQWIAQGNQAHSPGLGDETAWTFYDFDPMLPQTLIGEGSLSGVTLYLTNQNPVYGLQLGDGANSLNTNANGISSWFSYTGTSSGSGDINGTYNCNAGPGVVVSEEITEQDCGQQIVRTWTATDDCGNESQPVSQTITVIDTTAPVISAAGANATVDCLVTPVFTAPTATDACDPNPTIVLVSDVTADGSCAGSYVRTKTWKAVDACGNESAAVSQSITVQDITAPSISAAGANATINCPSVPVFTAPTATDVCDSNPAVVIVSDVTTPGACTGSYARTITWKAVDACGNESDIVSQTITVIDTTAPSISAAGANATINCPAVPVFTAPTATDTCDPNPTIVLVSDVTVNGECAGSYSVTCTWVALDDCGNESQPVSQTITVIDTTAPVISAAGADATVDCLVTPVFTAPTATDACDPNPTIVLVSDVTVDGACAGTYVRTRTWKAVDACGNESAAVSQSITVQDITAPSISAAGANATVDCLVTPVFTAPTATDACDPNPTIVLVSDVTADGSCAGSYVRTRTWKAVDACGNESGLVSQTITVIDTTAPVISAAGANATINCPAVPVFTAPTATDTCDPNPTIVLVSDVTVDGACAGSYVRTRTWKAVDA
ncbi:MAG: hypothetical protein ACK5XQ_01055 [Flavobacteriales bacterium]